MIYLFGWMVDTNSNSLSQIKVIETFAHTSLGIGNYLVDDIIFSEFILVILSGSKNSISTNISKSKMFSFLKTLLISFSRHFWSKPHKILAFLHLCLTMFPFYFPKLHHIMFISRGLQPFRPF